MKNILLISVLLLASTAFAQTLSNRVPMSEARLLKIIADNQVTELDQVPGLLPKSFVANFTLKHGLIADEQGRTILGPRGHLTEADIPGLGQHSLPLAPRAFVFDPSTGFAISYNGGQAQGGETLDTLSFDFTEKKFRLVKIDFPLTTPGLATTNSQNCTLCHGPNNRPIFSMYPDWPRFYGSDNDELRFGQPPLKPSDPNPNFQNADALTLLRRDIQLREFKWFHLFKDTVVPHHPRYAPLFAKEAYAVHGFKESNEVYREYPYRSDVEQPGIELNAADVSRSFTRRAGLRFNLLYSRLFVQQVTRQITTHPRFEKFAPFFVYNIMRCGPETGNRSKVMQAWQGQVQNALLEVERNGEIEYQVWNPLAADVNQRLVTSGRFQLPQGHLSLREQNSLLDYGQNLALFGLKINDVDMRLTYHHEAYKPENAYRDLCANLPAGKDCSDQVMQVGYLQHSYFNSYNDGSTTMDEHLTASLLETLSRKDANLAAYLKKRGPFAIRGLLNKYSGPTFKDRMLYDREFFTQMDGYAKWFSLPYPLEKGDKENPRSLFNLHHRATFTSNYRESYLGVCGILEKKLLAR